MAKDLEFVDPAFTCKVVLTGPARALYEAAQPEFERLEGLRNLGLMAHIHRVARHTRHDHLVGMMRIFNKLNQQPVRRGLPKEFLWSFWCRLCFGQTGHAALSYDSEKGVMLACHLNDEFRDRLKALLQPVVAAVNGCSKCTRVCAVKASAASDASKWLDELVSKNRWYQLHRWIAALKLLRYPKVLNILNGQTSSPGFSQAEALKLLVAPQCAWEKPLHNLSRLDFIPRDLAFAGTIGIWLDVDSLVAAAAEDHPDWRLLGTLSDYMSNNIYESPSLQLASVLYQRALADILLKDRLSIDALFGIAPAPAITDDALRDAVSRTSAGKQVFDDSIRRSWRLWPISTFVEPGSLPSTIEKTITGHTKGHLQRHVAAMTTCVKLREKHFLGIAMRHGDLANRPDPKAFVKLCRSLLLKQAPRIDTEELADALYEGLVDRECEHGLEKAIETLGGLSLASDVLKGAAEIVNNRSGDKATLSGNVAIKIGEFSYPLPLQGDQRRLQINVMHAAISGDEERRQSLGISLESAAGILWAELLQWQSIYFGLQPSRRLAKLIDAAKIRLAQRVVAGAVTAETDLEIYTLLEALGHPGESVSFRIALPNLKLTTDGKIENEYDVVSIVLKNDKEVEVWVWGVTTEQDLTPKRDSDMAKIQKLKDLLGNRWEADVRVVPCYVHRHGNQIRCEVDGRQERRDVPQPPPLPAILDVDLSTVPTDQGSS